MTSLAVVDSMAPTLLASCAATLVASLAGSVHCAGMCGGLAACATANAPASGPKPAILTSSIGDGGPRRVGPSPWATNAIYHGSRAVGYVLLGLAAGAVGAALDLGGSLVGIQRVASLVAGATIAVLGAVMLLRIAGVGIPHLPMPAALARSFATVHRRAMAWPATLRALAIGAVTPLLPCGWLYAFVAIAAGAGSMLGGAAIMTAFWLGTIPALVAVSVGVRLAFRLGGSAMGRALPTLAAVLMIAIGAHLAIVRGAKASLVASSVHPVAASSEQGTEHLEQAIERTKDELPACCRGEAEP